MTAPPHPWVAAGADRVRFGLTRVPVADRGVLRAEAQRLEDAGFDALLVPDHPLMFADPWVSLAAAADATRTLRLGALVSCVAYRHPAMLARAVADVDRLSGGRAVLGVGSGDMPWEFGMLGLDHGSASSRRARLDATLRVLPALLRGEPVTAEGPGFALRDAVLPAPAVQEPGVPIVVAGGSRGTMRLAAAHADALNIGPSAWAGGAYTGDDVEARFAVLDDLCAAAGRLPGSVLRTGFVGLSIAPTRAAARAAVAAIPPHLREFFHGFFHAGTPDDTVAHLDRLVASGHRYLVLCPLDVLAGGWDMTDVLAADVLPHVGRLVHAG